MQKLTNLILGLILTTTSLFSQSDSLNRGFEEVSKSIYPLSIEIKRNYDINSDSIIDLSKIYVFERDSFGVFNMQLGPKYYIFYMNKNQNNEVGKILYDEKMDGLNGNEELIYNKPKRIKVKASKI